MKKIYLSILTEGFVNDELTIKLTRWLEEAKKKGYDILYETSSEKPVENNRNKIVKRFLTTSDADYLLMIDNDVCPEKNPFLLVEYNLDIISCPCPIFQHHIIILNCYLLDNDGYWQPISVSQKIGLIEIDATGTGCILLSRRVLEKIKNPFSRKWNKDGIALLGSDLYFSKKAKEMNFKMHAHFDYLCSHYKQMNLKDILLSK